VVFSALHAHFLVLVTSTDTSQHFRLLVRVMIFHLLHGAPHYNITLFSTPFSLEIKAETKGLLGMSRGVRSILLDNFSTHWHIFLQHAIRCSVLIMLSAHHHVFVQCVGNVHVVFSFSVLGTT